MRAVRRGNLSPKRTSRCVPKMGETSSTRYDGSQVSKARVAMDRSQPLAGKRILIAEDEPFVALDHATVVAEAGAEVVATCVTVTTALRCLAHEHVDVALIDYVLADRNSEPLQAALRQQRIELSPKLGDGLIDQAAALGWRSPVSTSSPSENFGPRMTLGNWLWPSRRRQLR